MRAHHLHAGAQHQMKGIAENDLRAQLAQFLRGHGLDRAVGTDRHECRRLDDTALEGEATAARGAVSTEEIEFHGGRVKRKEERGKS